MSTLRTKLKILAIIVGLGSGFIAIYTHNSNLGIMESEIQTMTTETMSMYEVTTVGFPTVKDGEWTYHTLNYYELGELEGQITRYGEVEQYIKSNMAYPFFFALEEEDSYRIIGAQLEGTESNNVDKSLFDNEYECNLKMKDKQLVYSMDLKGIPHTQAYVVGKLIRDSYDAAVGIVLNKK